MRKRLEFLFGLRDSFDSAHGNLLVEALLSSEDQREFNLIALLVIPKWLVALHNFSGFAESITRPSTRSWLYISLAGHRLPELESYLNSDLESNQSTSLAAACYCIDNGIQVKDAVVVVKRWFELGEFTDTVLIQPPTKSTAESIMSRYPELF